LRLLNLHDGYTKNDLKKQYHIYALKCHPDKTSKRGVDTTDAFRDVNDAYNLLNSGNAGTSACLGPDTYEELLLNIIKSNALYSIFLSSLDIETLESIGKRIRHYLETHTLADTMVKCIESFIKELDTTVGHRRNNTWFVKPSIDDLLDQKIFKLEHMNADYYVPLWHSEMDFTDICGNTFTIKVEPILDNHIDIDENNNIHIYLEKDIHSLLTQTHLSIAIASHTYKILIRELKIQPLQIYTISNMGIPHINNKKFNKITSLGDIIVHLTLY